MNNFNNHPVVVITGAASGIGLALATVCIQKGFNVVMADHDVTSLCDQVERLSQSASTEVLGVVCDVVKLDSVKQLAKQTYERFNRVDYLFNNAGISGHLAPIWELTNEHVRKVLDVNLHGVIHCVQVFLPLMFKQESRSYLINMASMYGLCSGSQIAPYAMSKSAIVALSESLYFDLKRLNKPVDVSVVCPSFVNTPLLTNSAPLCTDTFHEMMCSFMEHCSSPMDIATYIMQEVLKKSFYILPDKEVKDFFDKRAKAILENNGPHEHSVEKIISSLSARAKKMDA